MALTIQDVLEAIRVEDSMVNQRTVTRIQKTVESLVEHYAPNAPVNVKDQAIIQATGYIHEAPAASPARTNFANAFHNSGAASLLAPWREHSAGVIREEELIRVKSKSLRFILP